MATVKMRRKGEEKDGSGKLPKRATGRDLIDESLRRVYDDLLEDDVPDRFKDLLRQLRGQDAK